MSNMFNYSFFLGSHRLSQRIKSLVTLIWDGWSTKNRRSFTAMAIQWIDEEKNGWKLKSMLLSFDASVGRHTGKAAGREIVSVVRRLGFEDKVSLSSPFA